MKVITMNISLPPELASYVREKVDRGQYASASEVVREALRCLSGRDNGVREGQIRTLSGLGFDRKQADEAANGIRELQQRHTLGRGLSIEDLINEDRRT